jgi:hypothetical protein
MKQSRDGRLWTGNESVKLAHYDNQSSILCHPTVKRVEENGLSS